MYKISASIIFFFVISKTFGQEKDLRCYNCKEFETKECGDPVEIAKLSYVTCKDLIYNRAEVRDKNYENALDLTIRQLASPVNSNLTKYSCLKAKIKEESDNKYYIQRTCIQLKDNVEDHCDLIKEEIGSDNIDSCNLCAEDVCNSSKIASLNWMIGSLLACFVAIIIKL